MIKLTTTVVRRCFVFLIPPSKKMARKNLKRTLEDETTTRPTGGRFLAVMLAAIGGRQEGDLQKWFC